MFKIEPNVLYSREDLERELDGLMDVETFLLRISPRRRYKSAWWGQDLIEALNGSLPDERTPVAGSRVGRNRPPRLPPRLAERRGSGLEPIKIAGSKEGCTGAFQFCLG